MKKNLTIFGAILLVALLSIGCGGGNQNNENSNSTAIETSDELTNEMNNEGEISEIDEEAPGETEEPTETIQEPEKDGSQTITAKFVSASAFEGQATLTFKKDDGTKILFCRNYMNTKEPELKFNFVGDDAASANTELVGKVFIIKYKVNKTGKENMQTGDPEPCNQIFSVEKK